MPGFPNNKRRFSPRGWARGIVLTAMGAAGIFAGFYFFSGMQPQRAASDSDAVKIDADAALEMNGIRQTAFQDGAVQWRLDAVSARYSPAENRAVFQRPALIFHQEEHPPVTVTALEGEVDARSGNLRMEGDVVMAHPDYRLETRRLEYRSENGRFTADEPVTAEGPAFSVAADGGYYELHTRTAVLSGNVKGEVGGKLHF